MHPAETRARAPPRPRPDRGAADAVAPFTVTMQLPMPEHEALHPVNPMFRAGTALKVTVVPRLKDAEHVGPQLIPAGTLVTTPPPLVETESAAVPVANAAVTLFAELIVRTHEPVPEQAPLHPANTEPEAGVADTVTDVPVAKLALHVEPQLMPAGALATAPDPVPLFATLSVCGESHLLREAP